MARSRLIGITVVGAMLLGLGLSPIVYLHSQNASAVSDLSDAIGQIEEDSLAQRSLRRRDFWRSLNLSRDQIRRLQGIRKNYQPQIEEKRQQYLSERSQFRTLLASAASNDSVREQFESVQKARQDFDELRFESVAQMRSVLTPEQRAKLSETRRQSRNE